MAVDPRFLVAHSREIFNGNELLVKGCLEVEGGVGFVSGYPGSPVAGFFDTLGEIQELLREKGIRAYQANNEALAAAALNGSQMIACRGLIAMKSVGLHVASDALALANLAGVHPEGGAVVVSGDDPWCDSTQVPADSRFLFQHLRMPVVEPGSPQELKDWVNLCFKLSRASGLYIGYLVTNPQIDGGGTVCCNENHFPQFNTNTRVALETRLINLERVLLPPRTWQREIASFELHARTVRAARELEVNRIQEGSGFGVEGSDVSPVGFIVTGMAGPYLDHVLADAGLGGRFPILRMGMSYPADSEIVRQFGRLCGRMIVVEERRSFLEMNIRDALFRELPHEEAADLSGRLYGKRFPRRVRSADLSALSSQQFDGTVRSADPTGGTVRGADPTGGTVRGADPTGGTVRNADPTGGTVRSADPTGGTVRGADPTDSTEGIPETRGLNYSVLAQRILPLIQSLSEIPEHYRNGRISSELARLRAASRPRLDVVSGVVTRTATFCPGCPHRDSSSVLLDLRKNLADPAYMQRMHGRAPVDLVAHGDTGCYTMLMFPPTEQLMHNYSGMGLGAGTGSGIDPFITNKQIVFMGDSTFFHSGQIAISNAVKAGQDLTFIILENGTTAMTGHQDHAAIAQDMFGNKHPIVDIYSTVAGIARTAPIRLFKADPADREKYNAMLEEAILAEGVKVVIADKECGITRHRKELREEREIVKEKGYLPRKAQMNITPEVCEGCLECTKQTACPGLTFAETDYGRKVDTDVTWCVNDGACDRVRVSNEAGTKVKPCPSFEEITVVRSHRRRYLLPQMSLDKLPEPERYVHDLGDRDATWRCHMSGVGGMGIGVVGAILLRAGHKEGYRVVFTEKKGLAIRNGGVFAQITFVNDQQAQRHEGTEAQSDEAIANRKSQIANPSYPTTGSIPYGRADLLLGLDVLEAARAVDSRADFRVASRERTAAVLNMHKQATVATLLGRADFEPERLREEIMRQCREDQSYARNLAEICEQRLGSKQFVNIMMLGVAYQFGLIPVSAHSMAWAIKDTIRREHRRNLKAFNIGRKLALEPRALPVRPEPRTWEQLLTNKSKIIRKTRMFGPKLAIVYERIVETAMRMLPHLSADTKYDLTLRIYDIFQYENDKLARKYLHLVKAVYRKDSARHGYAATRAAIANLAKVILIKDEVYVSYLLTRYEKKQRDLAKYGVDVANGDKIVYRHHTQPEFAIGQRRFRLNITTSDWMLNIVRRFKFLRSLPGWHAREQSFRDWYMALLNRVDLSTDAGYERAVKVLACVDEVSGYREIRYPKMQRAREWVERELSRTITVEAEPGTANMRIVG
ncbi:MAG: DUF6537 domain-containing protein [Tepidisphaerales bacterium]